MTGCKFGKYCRIGSQCPYLHPQMEIYNSTLGQVTHTLNNNVKILYIDTTEEKKTRRIPSPPSKRDSRSRRQKIQSSRRYRNLTIQGQSSDGSRTPTLKRQRSNGFQYQEYDRHRPWIRGDDEDNPRIYRSRKRSRSESRSRKRSRSPKRNEEILQDIRDSSEEVETHKQYNYTYNHYTLNKEISNKDVYKLPLHIETRTRRSNSNEAETNKPTDTIGLNKITRI